MTRGGRWSALALAALLAAGAAGGQPADASPGPAAAPEQTAGQVRIGAFWIDRFEYPNVEGRMPRVDVSWEEAGRLCAARGARLCTESEWEQACRGDDNFEFGYGNTFEAGRCNTPWPEGDRWVRNDGAAPSGAYAECATPAGVHDLVGNVWEWTDGQYDPAHPWHVVRGGSWFHSVNYARADGRYGRFLTATYRLDLIGFRCCRSAAPPTDEAP